MSVTFDSASSEYLEYTAPVTATPFTISLWFKVPNITADHELFQIQDASVASHRWAIQADGSRAGDPLAFYIQQGSGTTTGAFTSTGYSANTWHHAFAVATSATDRKVYLDNAGEGTNTTSLTPINIDLLSIGALRDSTPVYGDGLVAEVGVWNAALDSTARAALAAGARPSSIEPASLVFYAPLKSSTYAGIHEEAATVGGTPVLSADDHPTVSYPNLKMILPDGRMFMTGAATYTAQGGGALTGIRHPLHGPISMRSPF